MGTMESPSRFSGISLQVRGRTASIKQQPTGESRTSHGGACRTHGTGREFGKREQEWHIWGSVCAAKCEFPGDLMAQLPGGEAGEHLPFSKAATNRK